MARGYKKMSYSDLRSTEAYLRLHPEAWAENTAEKLNQILIESGCKVATANGVRMVAMELGLPPKRSPKSDALPKITRELDELKKRVTELERMWEVPSE